MNLPIDNHRAITYHDSFTYSNTESKTSIPHQQALIAYEQTDLLAPEEVEYEPVSYPSQISWPDQATVSDLEVKYDANHQAL
jgi:hypothetical protein